MSSSPFNAYLSATMLSPNGGCPTFTMAPLVSNHCVSGRSSYIECWGTLCDAIAPIKDDSAALVTASHDGPNACECPHQYDYCFLTHPLAKWAWHGLCHPPQNPNLNPLCNLSRTMRHCVHWIMAQIAAFYFLGQVKHLPCARQLSIALAREPHHSPQVVVPQCSPWTTVSCHPLDSGCRPPRAAYPSITPSAKNRCIVEW